MTDYRRKHPEGSGPGLIDGQSDDLHAELLDSHAHLATGLPESLTISVDLPATEHRAPDDEAAVAIPEVAVDPLFVDSAQPLTTSIALVPVMPGGAPISDDQLEAFQQPGGSGESADQLSDERLLDDDTRRRRAAPEGVWPSLVYTASLHLVNIGDSARVRERKELDARIRKPFEGGTRFVPVLTRKGGVGKTTITTLLGMALADVRDDRVVALDANPDRGTLSERVNRQTRATVRDVVTKAPSIANFSDFSQLVSRDETRLDVLASDTDPLLSEAFDADDYNVVADMCARYYSIALTDCGTGIVHSVMRATLQRADAVVVVSGGSVDEARLASETLTWLEANGYTDLVRNCVVALNAATQGTNLVKLDEIEDHFRSRVREVVRIPYDPELAAGSVVNYKRLRPLTRSAARQLAAFVMDGLPSRRDA